MDHGGACKIQGLLTKSGIVNQPLVEENREIREENPAPARPRLVSILIRDSIGLDFDRMRLTGCKRQDAATACCSALPCASNSPPQQ